MQKRTDIEKQKMIDYFKVHQLSLKKVFSRMFNKKIKNITYLGNFKLNKILEYNFSVLKFNIVLADCTNFTAFIRLIEKFKIKESLYCYYFFWEENYSKNPKSDFSKVNIKNYISKKYEDKYELQLFGKDNTICKTSLINIINLKQYCKINLNNIPIEKCENVNKMLFIAII